MTESPVASFLTRASSTVLAAALSVALLAAKITVIGPGGATTALLAANVMVVGDDETAGLAVLAASFAVTMHVPALEALK
jgi:hypothetical protein